MKKKAHESGGGGGGGHETGGMMRWLLTYADMITLMLAFFIIMYALSNADQAKIREFGRAVRAALGLPNLLPPGGVKYPIPGSEPRGEKKPEKEGTDEVRPRAVRSQIPGLKKFSGVEVYLPAGGGVAEDSEGVRIGNVKIPSREFKKLVGVYEQLKNKYSDLIERGEARIEFEERGLVIRFPRDILFDIGKATLTRKASKVLDELAKVLRWRILETHEIEIEGHTDNWPVHTFLYPTNWELSTARASTVGRYLIEVGEIPPERFRMSGYGEYRPLFPNDTPEHKAMNRRVDVILRYREAYTLTGPPLSSQSLFRQSGPEPVFERNR